MKEYDQKREEIIETAGQLFNLHGYEHTSMRQIAIAMGSGKASLYYYFKSKEELFLSVIKKEGQKYFAEFEQKRGEDIDIIEQLRFFLMIPLNLYESHKSLALMILLKAVKVRIKRVQNIANEMLQGFFKVFRKLLQEGIDTGIIKADLDIERYMIVMLNIINSVYHIEVPGIDLLNNKDEKRINYEFLIDTMLEGIKK